jgi:hypothetical protein
MCCPGRSHELRSLGSLSDYFIGYKLSLKAPNSFVHTTAIYYQCKVGICHLGKRNSPALLFGKELTFDNSVPDACVLAEMREDTEMNPLTHISSVGLVSR